MSGPLTGTRVVELAGVGPAPFAAMMLADMGADVVRVDRASFVRGGDPAAETHGMLGVLGRGRRSVGLDLKRPEGVAVLMDLVDRADALLEPFRPGVAERLGAGPDECLDRNPRLVYARATGWGQEGPLAHFAGHDINYLAVSGVLAHLGTPESPITPLPLIGDFGAGGMLLGFGVVCALNEAARTGRGQVVDSSIVDGSALISAVYHSHRASGLWNDERGTNFGDGAAHFYNVYECADGRHVAVGAYEPQFYAELLRVLELDPAGLPEQHDRAQWPAMKERFATIFRRRTRDEWVEAMEAADACLAPVLTFAEAPDHPHNAKRNTFVTDHGLAQPAPAPRFSRTPGAIQGPPPRPAQHTDEVLADWLGLDGAGIAALRGEGAVA